MNKLNSFFMVFFNRIYATAIFVNFKFTFLFVLLTICLIMFCYPLVSNGQGFQKENFSRDSLTVRNAHAMAYNSDKGVVTLFGGADESHVLGDLWEWDGVKWSLVAKKGPPPRTFPALVYDGSRKELILFGGNKVLFGTGKEKNNFLNDMWIWKNNSWHQVETTKLPSPRAEASIAYDSNRHCVVLFGGYRNEDSKRIRLGDTWEWDGRRWELKSIDGPAKRNGTAMAYDDYRQCIVLYWGSRDSDQTWEWDGNKWKLALAIDTAGYYNSAIAYDSKNHSLIRFGGWINGDRSGDTWNYDGSHWKKISASGPSARNHTSMAYDSRRNVIVLFGGHDGEHVFGDTWEWNGKKWLLRKNIPPRLRVNNGH